MKKKIFLFGWLCLLFSFTSRAQDPPQYNTPYAGVPDPRDVNMYQVHIRPYSAAGNFAGVIARLDAIRALGTNVLYLMPIYPHGTDSRSSVSPYSIKDFKSVASEYGTLADLRTLVDGAHARGMAVMLDFAVNGTSWDHPWITQHPDWYNQNGGVIQQLGPFPDVAGLNFNNASMRAGIVDAMRYWIFAANIDGYRCDFANNPPLDFWTNTINNLRGITSHKLLMFAEGDRLENFQTGFDLNFGDKWYYDALKPIRNGTSVSQIQTTTNIEYTFANSTQQVVRYTTNHDVMTNEATLNVFSSHNGVIANTVVSAYMRGVPMIGSGQEVDFNQTIPWPWQSVKINWNVNTGAAADFTKVLNFRTSSTAIRRGTMTNYSNNDVCAFTKIAGAEKVVVITNLRSGNASFTIPAAMAGSYQDAYTNANVTLTNGATQSLSGFQYIVLKSGSSCTPTAIIPYLTVNGGAWTQTASATVATGGSVTFGPQPLSGGTWSWTGPNGYTSGVREISFTNLQVNQSGNYIATHINAGGCASTQTYTLTVNPPPSNLPAPWVTADIGAVAASGSASYATSTFTLNASGADVFDFADEFRYVYQPYTGNVTLTARLASLGNTNPWAKAGVMIRETLNANSANATMLLTPSNGFNFQYRNGAGAGSTAGGSGSGNIPNWIRITRSGNTLTGFSSTNGTTWTQVGTISISMGSNVYIGLFATSHNDGTLTTATFTSVTVTGGANNPPTANAGPNKSLAVGTTSTTLPGSGTDPEGSAVTYSWTKLSGPAVTLTNTTSATASVSGLTNGSTYVFQLTVSDGSLSASDQVTVTVASAASYYSIRNRWTNAYLYDAGANVGYGASVANNNYKWEKVAVDATFFLLRNLGTGQYMHIENQTGAVQCTGVTLDWWSAHWSQENVDATWVRFRNRWQTGNIIHVENQTGSAQYAGAQNGWYSAQWQLASVPAGRMANPQQPSLDARPVTTASMDIFPNPATGKAIQLSVSLPADQRAYNVRIYDLQGRIIYTKAIASGTSTINLGSTGMYIVELNGGETSIRKKVVVQ